MIIASGPQVDISSVDSYKVWIDFTGLMEPKHLSGEGLTFVSIVDEIEANSPSPLGEELREKYGRIPYGSPLYTWEVQKITGHEISYVGQTMLQSVQKRFEGHSTAFKILAQHVNNRFARVSFRLCGRLDIILEENGLIHRIALEHLPLEQARRIVDDIEAYLIFKLQPKHNIRYRNKEKEYWKPFTIQKVGIMPIGRTSRNPFTRILSPEHLPD